MKLYLCCLASSVLMACSFIPPKGMSDWHVKQRESFSREWQGEK